jgi:hypothetical protein
MTARIIQFPRREPSARCQWRGCRRRAWYALAITGLGDGPPELLCSQHLDVALQQSVVAPGDLRISPLAIDRSNWAVGRWAWTRARLKRLHELLETVGITERSA